MNERSANVFGFEAVFFDMDGTLIDSPLDFLAIRREIEVPDDQGILEHIASLPADQRRRAERILHAREMDAAREATLIPGAVETVSSVRSAGLRTALLTRNSDAVMTAVLERFSLAFDLAWSRDWGPIKPEPDGVLAACGQLRVRPERTACVGDFRYELEAAHAAGATAVLVRGAESAAFEHLAHHVLDRIDQLPALLGIERMGVSR